MGAEGAGAPAGETREQLRALMRQAPQLVTVVTAVGPDGPRGITVSSFTSVSLDPPLVLISIAHSAQAHAAIAGGRFRVHLLAADQASVSGHFARPGLDAGKQFSGEFGGALEGVGAGEPPRIDGCLGWLDCETASAHDEGDHTLFIGRVLGGVVERPGEAPLLYHDGAYRKPGGEV